VLLLVKPKQMKNLKYLRIVGKEKTETGLNELILILDIPMCL